MFNYTILCPLDGFFGVHTIFSKTNVCRSHVTELEFALNTYSLSGMLDKNPNNVNI
jgi:hypothetical protein